MGLLGLAADDAYSSRRMTLGQAGLIGSARSPRIVLGYQMDAASFCSSESFRVELSSPALIFDAEATYGDTSDVSRMSLGDITTHTMRTALRATRKPHEAAMIQRCWSTWNVLCMFLYAVTPMTTTLDTERAD